MNPNDAMTLRMARQMKSFILVLSQTDLLGQV